MRTLFSFNMITLDGFFEGPDQELDWHTVDAAFNEFAIEQLNAMDLILFGRVTYQMMASFWPTQVALESDPVIANQMNSLPKVVVSTTLDHTDWHNTRLFKDNIVYEIEQLKQQPGQDIGIFGSVKLTGYLLQMGLVDELRMMVSPVILGQGTPFFNDVNEQVNLKLLRTKVFNSGNVLLYYQPEMKGKAI